MENLHWRLLNVGVLMKLCHSALRANWFEVDQRILHDLHQSIEKFKMNKRKDRQVCWVLIIQQLNHSIIIEINNYLFIYSSLIIGLVETICQLKTSEMVITRCKRSFSKQHITRIQCAWIQIWPFECKTAVLLQHITIHSNWMIQFGNHFPRILAMTWTSSSAPLNSISSSRSNLR